MYSDAIIREMFENWGIAVSTSRPLEFKVSLASANLALAHGDSRAEFEVIMGEVVRPEDEANLHRVHPNLRDLPTMVWADYVHPRTATAFRNADVQYVDKAGNASVHFGAVYIDVQGKPRPDSVSKGSRVTGGLFAAKKAQVIFALLAWPELVHRSMREIAEAAGVSPALVHDTLALMRISGYDDHEGNLQASKLLDHWAAAYATTLGPQLEIQRYVGDIASLEDISLSGQILVGGETAVPDLLKPTTGTLYVAAFDHAIAVRRRWRTDGDWNIFVRRKFWREPQGLGSPAYVGNRVPWPLVYADLLSSGDPRLREVAEQLKSEHVETS